MTPVPLLPVSALLSLPAWRGRRLSGAAAGVAGVYLLAVIYWLCIYWLCIYWLCACMPVICMPVVLWLLLRVL